MPPSPLDEKEGEFFRYLSMSSSQVEPTASDSRCSVSAPVPAPAPVPVPVPVLSREDALARQVGLNAHKYLEERFKTEVFILSREKFNSVPEITKCDFTIKGHLGKGSFSDVFDVVCEGGQLFDAAMTSAIPRGVQQNRRRPARARRASLSSSINLSSLARPPQREDRRLVFAMKCLRHQIRSNAKQFIMGAEDLVHETAILANLDHLHIVKLHGRASGHLKDAFMLNDGYFILIDKLNETLQDRIDEWKKVEGLLQGPTLKQLEVAHSIADAMNYLHSKNIVFRDLKPANVGFDYKGVLKLFDFGIAAGLPEKDESETPSLLYDKCGTPRYMAPEVGLSFGYGTKADVYSFGILLWEVCAWTKPFPSITLFDEFERVVFMGGKRPAIKNYWPKTVKEIIGSSWSAAPSERPAMLDIKLALSLEIFNFPNRMKPSARTIRSKLTRSMTRRQTIETM